MKFDIREDLGFHIYIIIFNAIYHVINLAFEINHPKPKTWDYQLHHPILIFCKTYKKQSLLIKTIEYSLN